MREIIYTSKPANFDEAFALPSDIFRIKYYGHSFPKEYIETILWTDDEKICFGNNHIKMYISSNGKPYTRRKTVAGYTFTRKTKKGKSWFGKPYILGAIEIKALKTYLGIDTDWTSDLPMSSMHTLFGSNSVIAKLISGKITNYRDMIKEYLKYHVKGIKISPELMYQAIKSSSWGLDIKSLLSNARYLTNPDDCFKTKIIPHFQDMLQQARRLDRKVNTNWSDKKAALVHKLWTREIMAVELKYMEDNNVLVIGTLELLPDFELVTNQKRCFKIGSIEDHCIYTNYWSRAESKDMFILYGKYLGKMYTCSVERNQVYRMGYTSPQDKVEYKWKIGAIHAIRNSGAPDELRTMIETWLGKPDVIEFFNTNHRKNSLDDLIGFPRRVEAIAEVNPGIEPDFIMVVNRQTVGIDDLLF